MAGGIGAGHWTLESLEEHCDTPHARTSWEGMTKRTRALAVGVLSGDRRALSRAITLVESSREDHRTQAELLMNAVLQARALSNHDMARRRSGAGDAADTGSATGNAGAGAGTGTDADAEADPDADAAAMFARSTFRVGIAGPPGAGKSTFIEALGLHLTGHGHRVAVVAVDPSSNRSGGSILGDMTRMTQLSREKNAFVRPSPTRGTLGGLAEHTNDVVLLCEAGGYDIVLLETVGLGQSEVLIDSTCDMLVLLVPPAGGDELQGVKKGIMEVADLIVVNKAEGELAAAARHSAADFRRALQLLRPKYDWWKPRVVRTSALNNDGVDRAWTIVEAFRKEGLQHNLVASKRGAQAHSWMWEQLVAQLADMARSDPEVLATAARLDHSLVAGFMTPRLAAKYLRHAFMRHAHDLPAHLPPHVAPRTAGKA